MNEVLALILEAFESGKIPEAVAHSTFPQPNVPMNNWSFMNRTLIFLSGTSDARGFRQWQDVNRFVKKGAKAIYILVPIIKKKKEKDEEKTVLYGFKTAAVFKVEDTEGEPLDYEQQELSELPLMEKAKSWGISVKAVPGNYRYFGYYNKARQEIGLASQDECVFFHELTHSADNRLNTLKSGQDPLQEIVAELGAGALCHLAGKSGSKYLGNSYQYIFNYADKLNLSPYQACLKVLSRTEKALNLILN